MRLTLQLLSLGFRVVSSDHGNERCGSIKCGEYVVRTEQLLASLQALLRKVIQFAFKSAEVVSYVELRQKKMYAF